MTGVVWVGISFFVAEKPMRILLFTTASLACVVAAYATTGSVAAIEPMYTPTQPNQRGIGPADSARPGEMFFAKGVTAVSKKDYKFAVDMYRTSATWAYKPAQYNLGVIYFNGEGVAADHALGMAWLGLRWRLSAAIGIMWRRVIRPIGK